MTRGRRRRRFWALLLAMVVVGTAVGGYGCVTGGRGGADAEEGALTVFAAASLSDVFEEMGGEFEAAHSGVRVVFNFAGSQQLAQQLAQGAPGDVFASANVEQMGAVVESGRIGAGAPRTFARNRLAVVAAPGNPAGVRALEDLAQPGVRLVLADAAVPAGRYALTFLDRAAEDDALGMAFREGALANVVSYEQNVRTVLTKVALGEADAGIVYVSDAAAAEVEVVTIPERLNPVARYPIARLRDAERPALAGAFVEFVLSEEGQGILAAYGFVPAGAGAPTEAEEATQE